MANTISRPIERTYSPAIYALIRLRLHMSSQYNGESLVDSPVIQAVVSETIDACIKAVETAENANQR